MRVDGIQLRADSLGQVVHGFAAVSCQPSAVNLFAGVLA